MAYKENVHCKRKRKRKKEKRKKLKWGCVMDSQVNHMDAIIIKIAKELTLCIPLFLRVVVMDLFVDNDVDKSMCISNKLLTL